jgi:DnaJ homolog subfamily A member 5
MFIRKRDPRYKSHLAHQNSAIAAKSSGRIPTEQTNKKSSPLSGATTQTVFVEQAWQKVSQSSLDYADIEWAAAETGEDKEEWECVACGKTFRSEASWDSHERSKKHMQAVERLKKEMLKDEETLGFDQDEDIDAEEGLVHDTETEQEQKDSRLYISTPISGSQTPVMQMTMPAPEEDELISSLPRQTKKKTKKKHRAPSPEALTKTQRKENSRLLDSMPHEGISSDLESLSMAPDNTLKSTVEPERQVDDTPHLNQPDLSKREKRRAREAAKKVREAVITNNATVRNDVHCCVVILLTIFKRYATSVGRRLRVGRSCSRISM